MRRTAWDLPAFHLYPCKETSRCQPVAENDNARLRPRKMLTNSTMRMRFNAALQRRPRKGETAVRKTIGFAENGSCSLALRYAELTSIKASTPQTTPLSAQGAY